MLSSEHCLVSELLLDSEDLIIFCESVGSAWGSTLDFSGSKTNDEVSNEVIFGFSTSVRDHDSPSGGLGHVAGLDGLSHGSNLINLQEKGIAKFLVDSSLHSGWVSDKQVISNDLAVLSHLSLHLLVRAKIVLVEWIFNRLNWISGCHVSVQIEQLIWSQNSIVLSSLLTKVVSVCLGIIELTGSNIEADVDSSPVACVPNGLLNDLESVVLVSELWGAESTLVSDVASGLAELALQKLGKGVVALNTHLEGLGERLGSGWQDHELLHFETVSSVSSSVDDVEGWNWSDVLVGSLSSEASQVLVERDAVGVSTSSGSGKGHGQDGVGTNLLLAPSPFVFGSINFLDHLLVDLSLVLDVHADEGWAQHSVDVVDSLEASLTQESLWVLVSQLKGFVNAGRGSGRDGSSEDVSAGGVHVGLNGWVSSGVDDLSGGHLRNGGELSHGLVSEQRFGKHAYLTRIAIKVFM